MKNLKAPIIAMITLFASVVMAMPTRGSGGGIRCNSGGCSKVITTNGGMVVCDSDGCVFFENAMTND